MVQNSLERCTVVGVTVSDEAPEQFCGSADQRPNCGSVAKAGAAESSSTATAILMDIAP